MPEHTRFEVEVGPAEVHFDTACADRSTVAPTSTGPEAVHSKTALAGCTVVGTAAGAAAQNLVLQSIC